MIAPDLIRTVSALRLRIGMMIDESGAGNRRVPVMRTLHGFACNMPIDQCTPRSLSMMLP
jgi:hypothetical protein